MGTTPGGLPYPESTAASQNGANDIKALALAVDGRVAQRVLRGQTLCTFDAAGRAVIPLTGFTTLTGAIVQHAWNGDAPFAPMIAATERSRTNATQIGLWCAVSGTGALTWWTTPAYVAWIAWGT